MRPQQAEDEHGMDVYSAASGSFSQDAPGTSPNPDAHLDSSTQTEPDARPETRPAAAGLAPADAASLAHLLVARQPVQDSLAQALTIGARMCHDGCAFQLLTRDDDDDTLTLRQAAALGYASDDSPTISGEAAEATASLGHGARLDRQVLRDHLAVRTADTLYIPLVTAAGVLVGVLAITRRTSRRALDQVVTTLLAGHLTVLLDRRLRERTAVRLRGELSALARLADPSHVAATAPGSAPAAGRAAEDRLLLEAADLVRRVALPRALVTLAVLPEGQLGVVHAAAGGMPSPLAPEQAAILLAALRAGGPQIISARADAQTWHALAVILRDATMDTAGSEGESGQLTLLPVVSGDTPLGLFLLSHSASAPASELWLPLAAAIASSTAATGIRALRYAAEAAAEARSRDTYISLAAHELRSPLTSIKGYAQLLTRQSRKHPLPDTMVRSVEAIEQQSMRMAEMVGELLDASRIQRGKLELLPSRVDLLPLATRPIDNLRAQLPQQEIALEIEQPSLVGDWDPQRVEQIVRDLLDNAVRFNPEGNPIHVRVACEEGMALVSVRDGGIGIADGDRERIFDYLYRAPSAEQRNLSGLGLGLYICRHLSERMGGSLVLYASSIDEPSGSEFHLRLPLAEPS